MTETKTEVAPRTGKAKGEIRPFNVNFPEAELTDLRRRIKATRWPDRETVADASQGVQLATTQALAKYWASEHDWRKAEGQTELLPAIHHRDRWTGHPLHSRPGPMHDNALPLIITHGWPGSVIEQLKVIEPLTNPTAHGGTAADAFHVVVPSLPGYGFFRQADGARLASSAHSQCLDRADEAPWIRKVRGAGRRLG